MAIITNKSATEQDSTTQPISKQQPVAMPLSGINFILMGICFALIVIGFVLMSGSPNEGTQFNADIFSSTRIVVAPLICFIGFIGMGLAIIFRKKK